MPITAETFELEHFEALRRGLDAAEGALRRREEQLDEADEREYALNAKLSDLEATIIDLRAQPWDTLIEFILDVDRGIRDFSELVAQLRKDGWI